MTAANIDYSNLPDENILCIDMKSFYASVEAVERGLNPLKVPLVVVGDKKRKGAVVLAASPMMKKEYNISTADRLYQIPDIPEIIFAKARMGLYIQKSMDITRLFNNFVPLDDMHVYSIDESWLKLNKDNQKSWNTAKKIKRELIKQFKLPSSMALGPNMFLSKVAMDVEGKKRGLVKWGYDDIPNKLWPLSLRDCWGIGSRLVEKLNEVGLQTLGDLAHLPLEYLENKFGIMGNQLYYHAWGVDLSKVEGHYLDESKSIGRGITLYQDYYEIEAIKTVIFDLSEVVAKRARDNKVAGKTISLSLGYSRNESNKGFNRQKTLNEYINLSNEIYKCCLKLLEENYKGEKVRKVSLNLSNLVSDTKLKLNLFEDKDKKLKIAEVKDKLVNKYGGNALFHGRSLKKSSVKERIDKTIGGHNAW